MLMKKKQLLREIPNKESYEVNDDAQQEVTALGINLNQPLTDQLAKHRKGLKPHGWDEEAQYVAGRPADRDTPGHLLPENMKSDYLCKKSDIPQAAASPAPPVTKWIEGQRPESNLMVSERKSNQNQSDNLATWTTKSLDTHSNAVSYGKGLNGVASCSSATKMNSRRFDDTYKTNGKDFDEKKGSPSLLEKPKRAEKGKDVASSIKSVPGRNQSVCTPLLSERTSTLPAMPGYPLCSLPLPLLPTMPNAATLNHPSLSHLLLQQQQQHVAAARLQQLHLLQQQQAPSPAARSAMSTGPLLSSYSLHAADSLLTHQLEMLWQQKYPNRAVPPGWMLYQYQDELLRDPRIPAHQKEALGARDKEDMALDRERIMREIVEKDKLDWERQERENVERERMEIERHQKEKKERERWEHEKHDLERQEQSRALEHDRTLERERREWERHQHDTRRDQHLQLEMHQRRELIVDDSVSCASDAVNQHFQESFLRLASQKIERTRMEVANPSYAYMPGPRNIYRDRVKIERHQNPLCNKIDDDSKYGKLVYGNNDAKLQDMALLQRESMQQQHSRQENLRQENLRQESIRQEAGQHESLRRENIKHENSVGTKSVSHSSMIAPVATSQVKAEMLNFNLYGYQPSKDHLYNSGTRIANAHGMKDDVTAKVELEMPKYDRHDHFGALKNGGVDSKHDAKQASVIIEPRCSKEVQCDVYHHGSITLGTAGSGLHRGPVEGAPTYGGNSARLSTSLVSLTGSHGIASQAGSRSTIISPISHSNSVKDQKLGRNIAAESPKPLVAVSVGISSIENVGKSDSMWLAGAKEPPYDQWRDVNAMNPPMGVTSHSQPKPTSYQVQNIPSAGHLPNSLMPGHHLVSLPTCSLIQQGLVPNPLYISSVISSTGTSGALALPTNSVQQASGRDHLLVPGPVPALVDSSRSLEDFSASMKRRPKKEPNATSTKKKSRLETDASQVPISRSGSLTGLMPTAMTDSFSSSTYQSSQPAYLDSFKSFVDHAVQNAFLQDKDVETDQSPVREKMRQLIDSEPKPGDDAVPGSATSAPVAAVSASKTPEPEKSSQQSDASNDSKQPAFTSASAADISTGNSTTPPLGRQFPALPPALSQQPPMLVPSPGGASLSSLSSLTENVNRGRSGCLDTDSDTLSAHSPTPTAPPATTGTPPPPGSGGSSIHHKFHRKAWLHHYLNEDKKNSTDGSIGSNKTASVPGDKALGVKDCVINLSYITKDANSQSPVKIPKELALAKYDDPETAGLVDPDSESTRSTDGQGNKRTRMKKPTGSTKRMKPSYPDSPPMPDLVQEKQLETSENISDQSQEEDDNMDTQSSSSSKIQVSDKQNEFESLSSQTDCETKMAVRLQESKEKGKLKGSPSAILENKPLNMLSEAKRKKSKEAFLQDGACSDVTPKLVKCRECKMTRTQRNKNLPNIFCRFYAFRKLRYSAKGFLTVAGFSKPTDADADDIQLWMPLCSRTNSQLTVLQAKYILVNIKDSFLMLFDLENEASSMAPFQAKVAWKRPIQGVREMCDVCDATLFDIHWACQKCGFAVCADCYRSHNSADGMNRTSNENQWLTCSANRQEHEPESLMITQIVPSDVRMVVGRMLREVSTKWKIQSMVRNDQLTELHLMSRKNGLCGPQHHILSRAFVNGMKLDDRSTKGRFGNRKKPIPPPQSVRTSDSVEKTDSSETIGACSDIDSASKGEESKGESGSEDEASMKPAMIKDQQLPKHKLLNVNGEYRGSSEEEATPKEEIVPDEEDASYLWLDDGRLLQLLDSHNPDNVRLFQIGWQNAIPVLISNCDKQSRSELWSPASFSKEFGHTRVDLVDCATGVVLKSQPMDKFWNGFRHSNAPRGKQGAGASSILRLKDWPSVEDWTGPLTGRSQDLNRSLPIADYSHSSGAFNLISHLPEFFVRPDLATRIHAAYSSCAQHRVPFSKLRLDLADSVNIMMYVEPATAEDNQNATRALKEAGYNARAKSASKTSTRVGAVWHIFRPQDADKIREFLKKVDAGNSSHRTVEQVTDPLSDNSSYLDKALRARLLNECGIQSTVVVQCLGDALFLPALTPYQVKVIHSCVMVSKEFLSPESVKSCFDRMQQARRDSSPDCTSNLDDQLQIKNIIYHSVKDSIAVLQENDP